MSYEYIFKKYFERADIQINGSRPWDITVHDKRVYAKAIWQGSLGFGEAYMDGWWDCEAIDIMIYHLLCAGLQRQYYCRFSLPALWRAVLYLVCNMQTRHRAHEVAERHYDMDNNMFSCMLGDSMNYSCGYWKEAKTLEEAQRAKMALICKKLQLQPDMHVLDIGSGWGGLARYMVREYGVRVTAATISTQQIEYVKNQAQIPAITWLLKDYRDLAGQYDRVVSVGMFEHVGRKNYASFFQKVRRLLYGNGLFLLHTIGSSVGKVGCDAWISRYIFPNGSLPSLGGLGQSMSPYFVMEDWHNFGNDYDKTLMAWYHRFMQCCKQQCITWDARRIRMFTYYLLTCAGAFRARDIQLWQIVLSPLGCKGGYDCR